MPKKEGTPTPTHLTHRYSDTQIHRYRDAQIHRYTDNRYTDTRMGGRNGLDLCIGVSVYRYVNVSVYLPICVSVYLCMCVCVGVFLGMEASVKN